MKRIVGFLCLTMLLGFSYALINACSNKPAHVQFFTGTWHELLAEAKKQNKPIFVEVHTVWCGPCRLMEKQAFPNPEVAEKFNANFINYQIDMEQGQGPMLRKKYAITAVPTLLYLSPDGTLIYRSRGYDTVNGLLTDADKAIKEAEAPSPLSTLEADYAGGRRDTPFLRTYLLQRTRLRQPNAEALEIYMKRIPAADWSSTENIKLMTSNSLSSTAATFTWLLDFVDDLHNDRSKANTRWLIIQAVDRVTHAELEQTTTQAAVERIIATRNRSLGTLSADNKAFLANRIWMDFYERTKNQAGYRKLALPIGSSLMRMSIDSLKAVDAYSLQLAAKRAKHLPASSESNAPQPARPPFGFHSGSVANQLNKLARAYLVVMNAPTDFQQALVWSERTVTLMPVWPFLDTHAQLLGKVGRKAEAITTAQRAIDSAKAAGEDTSDYEKTLATVKR